MDILLTLILSCSVHYDDNLVRALAAKLSVSNQFFVGDLATLNTYDGARSIAEARQIVDRIAAQGGRPAVGYLAIPVAWAPRFGRSIDDLFDGCVNIGVGTAMLSEYANRCSSLRPGRSLSRRRPKNRGLSSPSVRHCILRRLEIDLDITGVPQHVLPEIAKLEGNPPDPDVDPPPARSPLFPDNSDASKLHEPADWSSPRLFLSSPTARFDRGSSPQPPPTATPPRGSEGERPVSTPQPVVGSSSGKAR